MNYKGFSILYDNCRGWLVVIDAYTEWLAIDKNDAMRYVDKYLCVQESRNAA